MSAVSSCPKCGVIWPADKPLPTTECPSCGVIFAKFHAAQAEKRRLLSEQEADAARAAEKAKAKAQLAPANAKPSTKPAALAACKACGGMVAYGAKACPHCGAPGPRRTTSATKAVAGLILLIVALAYCSRPERGESTGVGRYGRCPDIVPAALWLPKGHEEARDDFIAKAYLLNARGQCVLDGSYGEGYRKYYYSIRPLGEKNAKHVRFTRDELRPGR